MLYYYLFMWKERGHLGPWSCRSCLKFLYLLLGVVLLVPEEDFMIIKAITGFSSWLMLHNKWISHLSESRTSHKVLFRELSNIFIIKMKPTLYCNSFLLLSWFDCIMTSLLTMQVSVHYLWQDKIYRIALLNLSVNQ